MGLVGYAVRAFLRNRGRSLGVAAGVIIAIAFISGVNIASDSYATYGIQKSVNGILVDMQVLSPVDNTPAIMGILQTAKAQFSEIQSVFPFSCQNFRQSLVLNATGPIDWPAIFASNFNSSFFIDTGALWGFNLADLAAAQTRLPSMINITLGGYPENESSVLIDEATAIRFHLGIGQPLSIGTYAHVGDTLNDSIIANITRTISGIFVFQNVDELTSGFLANPGIVLPNQTVIIGDYDSAKGFLLSVEGQKYATFNVVISHDLLGPSSFSDFKTTISRISSLIYALGGNQFSFIIYNRLYDSIQNQENSMNNIQLFLLIISIPALLIGIYLTLTLYGQTLERRTDEILQLRSKGATKGQITVMVLTESILIGGVGGFLGYLGGYASSFFVLLVLLKGEFPTFLSMNILHGSYTSLFFAIGLGLITCIFSVLGPTRRLGKLRVLEVEKKHDYVSESQNWYSKLESPALIIGIIPLVWPLIFTNSVIYSLPGEIRPLIQFISQVMFGAVLFAPFLLGYGIVQLFAGHTTPRFVRIAQRFASIVTPKYAWMIGRNIGRRPKQSGGVVFIFALCLSLSIVPVVIKASEEAYEENLIRASIGADIQVGVQRSAAGTFDLSLSHNISLLDDVGGATPAISIKGFARGSSGGGDDVVVCGINASEYPNVMDFTPTNMLGGDQTSPYRDLSNHLNGTILEKSWAETRGFSIGDIIVVDIQEGLYFNSIPFVITGFVTVLPGLGLNSYPLPFLAVNLDYITQSLWNLSDLNSAFVFVKLADQATTNGTILAQKIASTFPNNVQYSTALVDALNSGFISNPTFENTQIAPNTFGLSLSFQFFDVENVFILLIGSIGLIIIVSRSLVDRRREIATLRARGLEAKELLKLLAGEGTTLVILGTFVGLVGILVGYTLNIQLGSIALFGLIPRPFVIPGSMALQVGLVVSILLVTVWVVSWGEVRHTETPSIAAALRVYS